MDLVSSFLSKKNINNEEDIKFENYIKGEAKLNSEKQYIIESSCCFDGNKDNFKRHYDENKILEIHLNNMLFEQYLSFDNVKKLSLIINDNVKFDKLFINNCNELYLKFNGRVEVIDKININNCKFKQISINNHIDGNIEFQKCEFNDFNLSGLCDVVIKGDFKFNFCEVKETANFMNFKFKNKAYFKMSKFKDNVYFNNSHFYDYANFHECEFEKTACFYGVKFEKVPNFSQVIFKGNLNVVNANLNFDFENLKEKINQECEEFNKDKKEENKKSLDKFANDFRDSFRTFKNALIKDNNSLDASNFHKYELYCKEIELKQNWDKKGKNVENMTDLEKNISRIRDFVDFLLLGFYRKLCDHHTDFLRVFNNLILLIALYVLFIFIGGFEFNLEKKSKDLDKLSNIFSFFTEAKQKILNFSFIQQYYGYILIIFCIICLIFIIVTLYKILKDIQLDFIKNIIFKDGLKSLWNLCAYVFALLVILLYINIFIPKSQNNLTILSNIGIFFAFCIFYLWIVYLNSLFFRYILIVFSYIVTIFAMGKNIFILNPLIGKLVYDKISFDNPLFIHLTFAYTILMALVLFSLQKTARKNSIVPS
ncbi:pentapeptide repeat-containing protein [Campylobacter sp. W0014]|uniref:pentapeptide repeat-containing protein n=1 Tax=Campylobacter sp. W0014 TaxID=2735781 RepID=UPI001EC0D853|nr:pentapeptide repeat-containing protein [Campylobacter sp. W0014]